MAAIFFFFDLIDEIKLNSRDVKKGEGQRRLHLNSSAFQKGCSAFVFFLLHLFFFSCKRVLGLNDSSGR